ncbi:MAG: glycosyltransferase family 39 protein [Candidatus Omnitrophota bacterium]
MTKILSKHVLLYFIIILIISFHFINNYFWLSWDNTYLLYESADHFLFSFKVFEILKHHSFPWLTDVFSALNNTCRWHGVFIQYLTAPFYFILGATKDVGTLVSGTISLTVLVFSVFGIGKILYDEETGCLAAFIVSMYPLVVVHSRIYLLDLPLSAAVALGIYFLLKSNRFLNKKYSILFALATGIGLLIKFNYMLFILPPFIFVLWDGFKLKKDTSINKNIVIFICLVALIIFMFYRLAWEKMGSRIYECSWFYWGSSSKEKFPWAIIFNGAPHYLRWFLHDCITSSISFSLFLVFLLGIFLKSTFRIIVWVWFLVPVLLLALMYPYANVNRYYIPLLPAMALISSAGIMACASSRIKSFLIYFVLIFSFIQYFIVSYRVGFRSHKDIVGNSLVADSNIAQFIGFSKDISFSGYRSGYRSLLYPIKVVSKTNEMLNVIDRDSSDFRDEARILIIGDNVNLYESFLYEVVSRGLPFEVKVISRAEEPVYLKNEEPPSFKLAMTEYVIFVNDKSRVIDIPGVVKARFAAANKSFLKIIDSFDLVNIFHDSEGTSFFLYRNKCVSPKNGDLEFFFRSGLIKIRFKGNSITENRAFVMLFDRNGKNYNFLDFPWHWMKFFLSFSFAIGVPVASNQVSGT